MKEVDKTVPVGAAADPIGWRCLRFNFGRFELELQQIFPALAAELFVDFDHFRFLVHVQLVTPVSVVATGASL
jgi:hypothetical protein